jgi:hypothetical protein
LRHVHLRFSPKLVPRVFLKGSVLE